MALSRLHLDLEHSLGCNVNFPENAHLHPDGIHYITSSGANLVIGNLHDPHEQSTLRGHDDLITCVALSPCGEYIASGQKGMNADIVIWSFREEKELWRFSEHDHGIQCIAFSHDSRYLASCGTEKDQKMFVWDIGSGRIVTWVTQNPNPTTAITWGGFVKDVKLRDTNIYQMATVGPRGLVLWRVDTLEGQAIGESFQQFSATLQNRVFESVTCSADGLWMFAGSTTGDIASVSLRTKTLQGMSRACAKGVTAIICSPANVVYAAGGDGTITELVGVHRPEDGDRVMAMAQLGPTRSVTLDGPVSAMRASADWSMLIVTTANGTILCIRLEDMAARVVGHAPNHALTGVCFPRAPNGGWSDQFVTSDLGGFLSVWSLENFGLRFKNRTGQALSISANASGVAPMCVSACDDFAVAGMSNGVVKAFSMDEGRELWQVDSSDSGAVNSIELSRNQRFFVTGSEKGAVKVWGTRQKDMQCALKQHTARVNQVKLSDDNLVAYSVGRDRALYTWDLEQQRRATGHFVRTGGIHGLATLNSVDPNVVLTTSQSAELTYWDLRAMRPVREIPLGEECLVIAAHAAPGASADGGAANNGSLKPCIALGGSRSSAIRLFDFESGQEISKCQAHSFGAITALEFAPDGRQIVSVGADQTIAVTNIFSE